MLIKGIFWVPGRQKNAIDASNFTAAVLCVTVLTVPTEAVASFSPADRIVAIAISVARVAKKQSAAIVARSPVFTYASVAIAISSARIVTNAASAANAADQQRHSPLPG